MKSSARYGDLKQMSADQLQDQLLALKKEQFNLRFQRATGQLENTSRIRVVRRDIARIKTLQSRQRSVAKASAAAAQPASAPAGA